MATTRLLLAAAVATILAAGSRAQDAATLSEQPTTTEAATPTLTLLDPGAEPRRLLRRTLQPGLSEQLSSTSTSYSAVAIVDGKKYPPTQRPPVAEQVTTTIMDIDPAGSAAIELTVADVTPPPPQRGIRAHVEPDPPEPLLATLRIDEHGFITDRNAGARDADAPSSFWEKKLSLLTPALPDQPVGPGARWNVVSQVAIQGLAVDQTIQYTLQSIDADQLTITGVLTIATREEHPIALDSLPQHMSGTITNLLVSDEAQMTVALDRILPLTARVESEIVIVSLVHSAKDDELQVVQYVRGLIKAHAAVPGLADVDADPE